MGQIGQVWLGWLHVGYYHLLCRTVEFLRELWLFAAQGYVCQVRDHLCGHAEYGWGVLPYHGESEQYGYHLLSIFL